MRRTSHLLVQCLALCGGWALACAPTADSTDAGSNEATTSDGGTAIDETPGDSSVLVGTFRLALEAPTTDDAVGRTSFIGKVFDGPTPSQIVFEEAVVDGDCQLLTPRVPFCETACGSGAACVEDDTCQAFPTSQDAGAVVVSGVTTSAGASSFRAASVANTYQLPGDVDLPLASFAEGSQVRLDASGGATGTIAVVAPGIAPLVLGGAPLTLTRGAPLELAWSPSTITTARVGVVLDISHHGGTRGKIVCATDDDGGLTLSSALVDGLLDLGVAGFPTVVLARESIGAQTLHAGRVELVLSSSVEAAVDIPGLTSCVADEDCADGALCRSDLTCG